MKNGKREAIVLSGGGALAAYEAGVLSALLHGKSPEPGERFDPEIVAGTSAGALNAAVLLSWESLGLMGAANYLIDTWLNRLSEKLGGCNGVYRLRLNVFSEMFPGCGPPGANILGDSLHLSGAFVGRVIGALRSKPVTPLSVTELVDISALLDRAPFVETLNQVLRPAAIQASKRALRITATDWVHGKTRMFTNEDMTDERATTVVMGSSALPGIFNAVPLDGTVFADGAVLSNTPLKPAIDAGADEIHVVYLDPDLSKIPLPESLSTIGAFDRMRAIAWATQINHDIRLAERINAGLNAGRRDGYRKLTIHRYHPQDDLGGLQSLLDLNRNRLASLIELGYKDVREHDCVRNQCIV